MGYVPSPHSENIWYFAYGSNMSSSKFIGGRGIHPLDVARVRLPCWTMTMEIPGLPYSEPAFSSIRPSEDATDSTVPDVIGVAYLISPDQYRRVIASEGGGIAYSDISVEAVPLTDEDAARTGPGPLVRTLGTILARHPPARPSERYMVRAPSPLQVMPHPRVESQCTKNIDKVLTINDRAEHYQGGCFRSTIAS